MIHIMKSHFKRIGIASAVAIIATAAAQGADAQELQYASPTRGDIYRYVTFPGSLIADRQATLHAKVSGYVKSIGVDIGDRVTAGQAIAELDVPEMVKAVERARAMADQMKADVPRAQASIHVADALVQQALADGKKVDAQLAADQSEFDRIQILVKTAVVSEKTRDEAANRLRATQAALASVKESFNVARARERSARADLTAAEASALVAQKSAEELEVMMTYATIRAPFDGIVTARHVDAGAFIPAATSGSSARTSALVTLMAFDVIRAQAPVPEIEASLVRVGQPMLVTVEGLAGKSFSGKVARHAYALDEATRSLRVEADLQNADLLLRPGMYAQMRIGVEKHENALLVPTGALLVEKSGSSVFLFQDGKAKKTPVKAGFNDGSNVEILSGMKGDERALIFGKTPPSDGAPVNAVAAK